MAEVHADDGTLFPASVDVLIVGAGAAGLVAALTAAKRGLQILLVERDVVPRGSTALSAGLIPAPATRYQRAAGIADSIDAFVADIMRKADHQPDLEQVRLLASTIGPALEWLGDVCDFPFSVVDNFTYPGHSAMRMHGLPSRSGTELMDHLRTAVDTAGIDILTHTTVETLLRRERMLSGAIVARGDGRRERIGCRALILACNGYGGDPGLVLRHIPEMAGALYFGHRGNRGDAIVWGDQLGAAVRHLTGYQGHGSVAHPHGILITWATITEGGFQVNRHGLRFSNEARGYSEAAAAVAAQPEAKAWTIFDARIAAIARQFEDFRMAEAQGAIKTAATIETLAAEVRLPPATLAQTFETAAAAKREATTDMFGRDWSGVPQLQPPYAAVCVEGALFHTQGGLVVDKNARVVDRQDCPFPNLFAVGGAACGVSGGDAAGYLSGNGLLSAIGYGYIAGHSVGRTSQNVSSICKPLSAL